MAFKYTVKAHPTMYNGVQYRSRLEARWAAFFDLAGWKHEYEPIDLPGWSPDFILHGKDERVIVEVKPVYEFPLDISNKIDAANPYPTCALEQDAFFGEPLILGASPIFSQGAVGWLRELSDWEIAPFTWFGALGFCHEMQSFRDRITGAYNGSWGDTDTANSLASTLWRKAGNTTQWNPRQ